MHTMKPNVSLTIRSQNEWHDRPKLIFPQRVTRVNPSPVILASRLRSSLRGTRQSLQIVQAASGWKKITAWASRQTALLLPILLPVRVVAWPAAASLIPLRLPHPHLHL